MRKYLVIVIAAVICAACSQKEEVTPLPNLAGSYTCSFLIPAVPQSYSVNEIVTLTKIGEGYYSVSGNTPFSSASLSHIYENQYQFRIPQTDIVKNGKTYYLTLFATLIYENGSFRTYSCQAAYGEKGVSGNTYTSVGFSLKKR